MAALIVFESVFDSAGNQERIMRLKKLKERRSDIAARLHAISDAAKKDDNRGFSAEERSEFDEAKSELEQLDGDIAREEFIEDEAREEELDGEEREDEERSRHRTSRRSHSHSNEDPYRPLTSAERSRVINAYFMGDEAHESDLALAKRAEFRTNRKVIQLTMDRGTDEVGEPFEAPKSRKQVIEQALQRSRVEREMRDRRGRAAEQRAQGLDPPATGGFLVPNATMRKLEEALLAWGGMREVSTVFSTPTGAPLPMPTMNDTVNKGSIVDEHASAGAAALTFGLEELTAYMYESGLVPVSYELMQDSATLLAGMMGEWLGTRIGRAQNEDFTTGVRTDRANGKPEGMLTGAMDSGITAAANTALLWDTEVLPLKHSVNSAYRRRGAGFMCHDSTLLMMKQMKDTQGRPLWLPNLVQGQPDLFDGDPVHINDDMPTGPAAKALAYGDFTSMLIREVLGLEIRRFDELLGLNRQVGFMGYLRADAVLLNAGTGPVKYLSLPA